MYKQTGVSVVALVVGIAALAFLGGGFFAWQKLSEVDRLQAELASTRANLEKARADLRKATQDAAATAKEASQLKVAAEQLRAERDAVRKTMETEQAVGVQLRSELALAKEQLSYLTARVPKDIVRGMPKAAR